MSVSDVGHVPLFIWCLEWLSDIDNGMHMWCVVGSEFPPLLDLLVV